MESVDDEGVIADATPVQDEGLSPYKAQIFAERWKNATDEKQEGQSFWREFFIEVVGLSDLREAGIEFEKRVISSKKGTTNYIDVYWKDIVLIEHKSAGKNLDLAEEQAREYLLSLPPAQRPPVIIVSDFARFRIVEYLVNKHHEFLLSDLPDELHRIEAIVSGHTQGVSTVEVEADQKAARLMAALYTELEKNGYEGHEASVFLVRILFCLFADDTRMWKKGMFQQFLLDTSDDGKDVGSRIQSLFEILDTPKEQRPRVMDDLLTDFPYVNGGLFSEKLPIFFFTKDMRKALLNAAAYDWSSINPTIFGSLFQSIKSKEERRLLGEHYTTEKAIDALLYPLILDELNTKLEAAWDNNARLKALQQELGTYQILDPACGSGNFLITIYKRLRQLELEIIKRIKMLEGTSSQVGLLDATMELSVKVEQIHGIEFEEWSSQIANVAMFLADHQENLHLETVLGYAPDRFPLTHSAKIIHANALTTDWASVCPMSDTTLIIGNPPFLGSNFQSPEQKAETSTVWEDARGSGVIDYVANWHLLASRYIQGTQARIAFVSTNSITQGEQVAILGQELQNLGVSIDFAHRTFAWQSDVAGKAAVHCVIIGLSRRAKTKDLSLWEYPTPTSPPVLRKVKHINLYLLDAPDIFITGRRKPLVAGVPEMVNGSKPTDAGFLSNISHDEAEVIKATDTIAAKYLRRTVGASELIDGKLRFCLWLEGAEPSDIISSPVLKERVEQVRQMRLASSDHATRADASRASLFQKIRQPETDYLAIPRVSSQNRDYVPMMLLPPSVVALDAIQTIPHADLSIFAILNSSVFNLWNRTVSGRLKSDFRLSAEITYNTFPVPELTSDQKTKLSETAAGIISAREKTNSSLAVLYNPLSMPPDLHKAHTQNDKAVLSVFGLKQSSTDDKVLSHLFDEYQRLTKSNAII